MSDLTGRIALVSGASRGIGYQVGLGLARAGAHVIAIARTVGGLEDLDDQIQALGGTTTLVPMDLTDSAAIDRLGAAIYERWGKLDILVGNAGILGPLSPLGHIKPKDWDKAMAVNVTANWRLIRSLDPLLRQSDAGRALFMTSSAARQIHAYWGCYTITKAALEALIATWAAELAISKAKTNLIDPGPLRTALRAQAWPGEDPETVQKPAAIVDDVLRMTRPDFPDNGTVFSVLDQTSLALIDQSGS